MITARLRRSVALPRTAWSLTLALLLLLQADPLGPRVAHATHRETELVSTDGAPADGKSEYADIAPNGRWVAFESVATNLAPNDSAQTCPDAGDDQPPNPVRRSCRDIFLKDRVTGDLIEVSVGFQGFEAYGDSSSPSVDGSGRYVAFESGANNLIDGPPGPMTECPPTCSLYLRDTQTNTTEPIAHADNGLHPSISAHGRYVAFSSTSSLVPGDTPVEDVYVHDRSDGQTARISVSTAGVAGNDWSNAPAISSTGRFVAFTSKATNLVAGGTNGSVHVYVRDRIAATTELVSVSSFSVEGTGVSSGASVSADGNRIAFHSNAANLLPLLPVPEDTNGAFDVFLRDRDAGTTRRISVASDGTQGNLYSQNPSISVEGEWVAFDSDASNLVSGDANGEPDVFLHHLPTHTTTLASRTPSGVIGNGPSTFPSVGASGEVVAFTSTSTNLAAGAGPDGDVYVHQFLPPSAPLIASPGQNTALPAGDVMVSGTTDPGLFIEVFEGATSLGSADADGAGAYSVNIGSLPAGSHTISVTATDPPRVSVPRTRSFTVDNSAPTSVINFPDHLDRYGVAKWAAGGCPIHGACGTASDVGAGLDKVRFSVEQSSTGNFWHVDGPSGGFTATDEELVNASGTTTWVAAFPISNFPADGEYVIHTSALDKAGNFEASPSVTFDIDRVAPAVTLTTPTPGALSDNTPGFSGTRGTAVGDLRPVSVEIFAGSLPSGTPTQTLTASDAPVDGWTATVATLADGLYTARAKQSDNAANVGFSSPVTIRVDTTDPVVSVQNPADAITTGDDTPTVNGIAGRLNGDATSVTVNVYDGLIVDVLSLNQSKTATVAPGNGAFSVVLDQLTSDGDYTVQVEQADDAGNLGTSTPHTFELNTAFPVVNLLQPVAFSVISDATPLFSGDAGTAPGDEDTVTIDVTGGPTPANFTTTRNSVTGLFSVESPVVLADGGYEAQACQENTTTPPGCSDVVSFTVDALPPVISGLGASPNPFSPNGDLALDTTSISASVSDATSFTWTLRIKQGNTTVKTFPAGTDPYTAQTWDGSGATADGVYTAELTVTDAAGNTTVAASTITRDVTPPTVAITSPADNSSVQSPIAVQGSAGALAGDATSVSVAARAGTCAAPGAVAATLTVGRSGNSFGAALHGLAEGPYALRATQSDSAGNVGTSLCRNVVVDATLPAVTLETVTDPITDAVARDVSAAGTVSEPSTVMVEISRQGVTTAPREAVVSGTNWSVSRIDARPIPDGEAVVKVTATDAAGNVALAFGSTVRMPLPNPPVVEIVDKRDGVVGPADVAGGLQVRVTQVGPVSQATVGLSLTDSSGAPHNLGSQSIARDETKTFVLADPASLPDGALNAVASIGSVMGTDDTLLDLHAPTTELASPGSLHFALPFFSDIVFDGTATDATSGITSVAVYLEGSDGVRHACRTEVVADGPTSASFSGDCTSLGSKVGLGSYTVLAYATDAGGNTDPVGAEATTFIIALG